MMPSLRAALLVFAILWCAMPATALTGELNGGILFIPDVQTILRPTAFDGDPTRAETTHVFEGFPELLSDTGASEDLLLDTGRRIGVYRVLAERDGVRVGQLPRSETVPFAMIEADDDGPSTLWLAQVQYGTLYLELGDTRVLIDLGFLYDTYIRETGAADEAESGFLPMAIREARFDGPLGSNVLQLQLQFLPGFDRVYTHPARALMHLQIDDETVRPVAVLVTELRYPDGFTYTAQHRFRSEDGTPAFIDEFAFFRTPLGSSVRYRLQQRSYFLAGDRFYPARSVSTLWEDLLPRLLRVGSEPAPLYREPGGVLVEDLPPETQVRVLAAHHRLDGPTGSPELWFRVQTAQTRTGWLRSRTLTAE